MSNVIRWRQLSNGEKFTPKTDLIVKRTYSEDAYGHFDMTGTQKSDGWISASNVVSVGKGQYVRIWTNGGVPRIELLNKLNNSVVNFFAIGTDNIADFRLKNTFTFLGQSFKSLGDEDRYMMFNFYDTDGTNYKFRILLWNIDKWEESARRLFDANVHTDLTYDGVDNVYCVREGNLTKLTFTQSSINFENVLDNTGAVIPTKRVYGISYGAGSVRLVLGTTDGGVRVILLSDNTLGGTLALGTNGTVVMCPAGDNVDEFDQSQSYIISTGSSTSLMKRSNTVQIQLSTNTKEKALNVIHFIHTPNVETEIWLVMINTDNKNKFVRKFRVDWSAGYGNLGVVSNVLVGTVITAGPSTVWESEVQNATNSYDIGKFYNYGLQKQWDLNNA